MKRKLILLISVLFLMLNLAGARIIEVPEAVGGVAFLAGGTPVAGGANYNVWDSQDQTSDLATNENTAGTNDITESSGQQTIDVNDTANNCFTYDTHTAAATDTFHYIDIKWVINEDFGGTWGNNNILIWQAGGTSPNLTVDALFIIFIMKASGGSGVADYRVLVYADQAQTTSKDYDNITYGTEYRIRLRFKGDGSTVLAVKFDSDAAANIASATSSRQPDRMFLGADSGNLVNTLNFTWNSVGVTTDISEIGLGSWS